MHPTALVQLPDAATRHHTMCIPTHLITCTLPLAPGGLLHCMLHTVCRAKARTAFKEMAKQYPASELPHRYLVSLRRTRRQARVTTLQMPCSAM